MFLKSIELTVKKKHMKLDKGEQILTIIAKNQDYDDKRMTVFA